MAGTSGSVKEVAQSKVEEVSPLNSQRRGDGGSALQSDVVQVAAELWEARASKSDAQSDAQRDAQSDAQSDSQSDAQSDMIEVAAELWDTSASRRTSVKQVCQQMNDERKAWCWHGVYMSSAVKVNIDVSVQRAVDDVRDSGLEVTRQMVGKASYSLCLGNGRGQAQFGDDLHGMQQCARKSLLLEAAISSALKKAEDTGVDMSSRDKESLARRAAVCSGQTDYDAMLASAVWALNHEKSVYAVTVNGYRKEGLVLVLSMSSLAESFDVRAKIGDSVAQVIELVQCARRNKLTFLGIYARVKLLGTAGTVLDHSKRFPEVLDHETDEIETDDRSTLFYSLDFLTGEAWREAGLPGATRWKHLPGKDFVDLFGMSKATFEKLPLWKQVPLKKKHGLF